MIISYTGDWWKTHLILKLSNEIPPILVVNDRGIKSMAYFDFDKIEALNTYFTSISFIDDSNETLSNIYV